MHYFIYSFMVFMFSLAESSDVYHKGNGDHGIDCGHTSADNDWHYKRVVGGDDAQPGSWPWQVSLQFQEKDDASGETFHYCGGVIIDPYWVLSVDHCKMGSEKGRVMRIFAGITRIGSYYLWTEKETVSRPGEGLKAMNPYLQELTIDKIILNEEANLRRSDKEILLVKLKDPIEYTDTVGPVCLAQRHLEHDDPTWVTGWGTNKYLGKVCPENLQEAKVPYVNRDICEARVDTILVEEFNRSAGMYNVTENMVCTGYEEGGKNPCHGDSGGPMVYYNGYRWELVGLCSWGMLCGYVDSFIAYVSVPAMMGWIYTTIEANS